ncbi:prepilin-type N-terminal cleavage/methylation domain-containing protein [Sulfurimonas sp. NWX367]|uniref:prepilin-type N-terminal cleavage/methylation domain-containing protein n=1 Tax=unclassified Sulfurimonas TaxID=2623549 RepID=UPI0032047780
MRTKAYTLIELIFVIIIIGVLAGTGFYYFKPHYLQNDRDFLELQLNTTRYEGLNYDKRNPSGSMDYTIGCIAQENFFTDRTTIDTHYKVHAVFTVTPNENILCFDTLGRVHNGTDGNKTTQNSLLASDIVITLSYNNEEKNITIDHFSGDLR